VRNCRSCDGSLEDVYDLGLHRLPDFTEPGTPAGPPQPLHLVTCSRCTLLQLADTTPRADLYHERYGFKSGVNEAVRADLADVATWALEHVTRLPLAKWLDIACNDGTLLSNVPNQVYRAGVDPLAQFAAEASEHADRIVSDYFKPEYFDVAFDVITSVSVFYDLDDPNEFVAGVASVLAPDGVWVIQQNYALEMLRLNAVDNVCHEHVTYFSVTSMLPLLERHGLEMTEVAYSPVNGGCFRALVTRKGRRPAHPGVAKAVAAEAVLADPAALRRWALDVQYELQRTRRAVEDVKASGGQTYVYGASTRGGTILQLLGTGPELLPYAVERQAAKVGKVMAATGIPIISEEQMRASPPAALLVSPWFFRDVFTAREAAYLGAGGKMIFPLPVMEVVSR
jgi:SAM-dependent methyltransferase